MKTREYTKAFKLLTQRLRDFTNDPKARLAITFVQNLRPHIVYSCNGTHYYFTDNYCNISPGNLIVDSHVTYESVAKFYSIGHLMKGFTKEDFLKMWLDNAIGTDLYIYNITSKLLDKNDTVESLCVQYDMAQV